MYRTIETATATSRNCCPGSLPERAMATVTHHLFVYGTLSPRHAPPEIAATVRRLRPVGAASVRGRLYDLGEYPGAVLNKNSRSVIRGEVFELPGDQNTLTSLDDYEGFEPAKPGSSLFVRRTWPVTLDDGTR